MRDDRWKLAVAAAVVCAAFEPAWTAAFCVVWLVGWLLVRSNERHHVKAAAAAVTKRAERHLVAEARYAEWSASLEYSGPHPMPWMSR